MEYKDNITMPNDYVYAPNIPEWFRFVKPEVYYDNCVNVEDDENDEEQYLKIYYADETGKSRDNIIDFEDYSDDDDDEDYEDEEYEEFEKPKKKKKAKRAKKSSNKKKKKSSKKKENKFFKREISQEDKRNIKIDIVHLMTERARIKKKLSTMDPSKKKGARKIAEMNIDLEQINEDIHNMSDMIGEPEPKVEYGSNSGRFFNRAKSKIHSGWKKFKKFCKRNKEIIIGVSVMVLPVAVSLVAKLLLKV